MRIILTLDICSDWAMKPLNINNVFLNRVLEEDFEDNSVSTTQHSYMYQPQDFEDNSVHNLV